VELDGDEHGEAEETGDQRAEDAARAPALHRTLTEGIEHQPEASAGEGEAEDVEPTFRRLAVLVEEEEAEEESRHADRDVDIEHPPP